MVAGVADYHRGKVNGDQCVNSAYKRFRSQTRKQKRPNGQLISTHITMSFQRIDQEQARSLIAEQQAIVVDIRDPASYASGHIDGALHLDNASLPGFLANTSRDKPVIVCCYHGNSSQGAAAFLAGQGFSDCYSLDGGYSEWRTEG